MLGVIPLQNLPLISTSGFCQWSNNRCNEIMTEHQFIQAQAMINLSRLNTFQQLSVIHDIKGTALRSPYFVLASVHGKKELVLSNQVRG